MTKKPKITTEKTASALLPILALATIILAGLAWTIPFEVNRAINVDPAYRQAVGGHIHNAYDSSTPELMVTELQKATQGMHDLGLEAGDYDTIIPWHKTPEHSMAYQYAHLQAVIDRANDVIHWRDSQGDKGSQAQLGDVYGQKVDGLRHFICCDGGWSDYIARDAFYVKDHPIYAWMDTWGGIAVWTPYWLTFFTTIGWLIVNRVKASDKDKDNDGLFADVDSKTVIYYFIAGALVLSFFTFFALRVLQTTP